MSGSESVSSRSSGRITASLTSHRSSHSDEIQNHSLRPETPHVDDEDLYPYMLKNNKISRVTIDEFPAEPSDSLQEPPIPLPQYDSGNLFRDLGNSSNIPSVSLSNTNEEESILRDKNVTHINIAQDRNDTSAKVSSDQTREQTTMFGSRQHSQFIDPSQGTTQASAQRTRDKDDDISSRKSKRKNSLSSSSSGRSKPKRIKKTNGGTPISHNHSSSSSSDYSHKSDKISMVNDDSPIGGQNFNVSGEIEQVPSTVATKISAEDAVILDRFLARQDTADREQITKILETLSTSKRKYKKKTNLADKELRVESINDRDAMGRAVCQLSGNLAATIVQNLVIPKIPFFRIVKSISNGDSSDGHFRWSVGALKALHVAAESRIIEFFADSRDCATHANRVTIFVEDFTLVRKLQRFG